MSEKLKRGPNFTPSEKLHLVRIVGGKYASIIEDKKTDRVSVEKKEKAWHNIAAEFNATTSHSIPRTSQCLKKCYENRKKELRKTVAEEKKEIYKTGGGPAPKKGKPDETDEMLLSIINMKTVVGLDNPFDDDAEKSQIVSHTNTDDEVEFILEDAECLGEKTNLDTTGSNKQGPVHPTLRATTEIINVETNEHKRKIQDTPKSRRRPTTIIKPLTSSDVAKKYDMLLDNRLMLLETQLRHTNEEHALNMRKKHLEIELLEADLLLKKKN